MDGKTGWFPSNYVEDMPRSEKVNILYSTHTQNTREGNSIVAAPDPVPEDVIAKNIDYRQQVWSVVLVQTWKSCLKVLRDLLEKEQEFVSDLRGLLNQYLQPLHHADM